MVFVDVVSRHINRSLGCFILRHGLRLRFSLQGGIIRDSTFYDSISLLPIAQRLLTIHFFDYRGGDSLWNPTSVQKDESSCDSMTYLERTLRPSLVPNERWHDVRMWQFNSRFLRWIRREILEAQYGILVSDAQTKLSMANGPPSSQKIKRLLCAGSWDDTTTRTPNETMKRIGKALYGSVISERGLSLEIMDVPLDADTSSTSLSDLIEVSGGLVADCGPLNLYCERQNLFQVWSLEYIQMLGDYIVQRKQEFGDGDTVVLDIGAGDGLLVKLLLNHLHQKHALSPQKVPKMIATDDNSWGIRHIGDVEQLSLTQTLDVYGIVSNLDGQQQQTIVLCSWMPMGEDWTEVFRQYGVDEYILIGESDDGQCGDHWETWGNAYFLPDDMQEDTDRSAVITAPYAADGYVRRNLDRLVPFQFSRFDSRRRKAGRTVSFRKEI